MYLKYWKCIWQISLDTSDKFSNQFPFEIVDSLWQIWVSRQISSFYKYIFIYMEQSALATPIPSNPRECFLFSFCWKRDWVELEVNISLKTSGVSIKFKLHQYWNLNTLENIFLAQFKSPWKKSRPGAKHIVGAPLIEEFSSLIRARITVFSRELSF